MQRRHPCSSSMQARAVSQGSMRSAAPRKPLHYISSSGGSNLPSVDDCQVETNVAAPQLCLLQAHNVCKHRRSKGISGGSLREAATLQLTPPVLPPKPHLRTGCSKTAAA